LLLGGGILAVLGIGGGAYFFLQNQEGPEDAAKEFIKAIDKGNLSDANDLIHSQATVDGAGVASQLLLGQFGGNVALDAIDISVNNAETVEQNDGRASVRLTLNIDAGIGQTEGDIMIEMRKEDGNWRVWNIGA
jgi:hypothetical protein